MQRLRPTHRVPELEQKTKDKWCLQMVPTQKVNKDSNMEEKWKRHKGLGKRSRTGTQITGMNKIT